jgi:hypothetical protein
LLIEVLLGLQVTGEHEAVELFGAAQFNIGTDFNAVPCLHDGVQAFMQKDGTLFAVAFGKVVACEQLSDGDATAEAENICEGHAAEPVSVAMHFGSLQIDNFADLVEVVAGIVFDFVGCEPFAASFVAAAGVTHECRVVADDNHGLMSEVLKLAELSQGYGVTQVHVDSGRINPVLHSQWNAGVTAVLQFFPEFILGDDFFDAASNQAELFFDGGKA